MAKKILYIITLCVFVIGIGAWYELGKLPKESPPPASEVAAQPSPEQPIASASFLCDGGKTITAEFFKGTTQAPSAPGQPPTSGGSAKVSFNGTATTTLHQTISADGGRYSNGAPTIQGSESLVFWVKGNGALVLENNQQKNFTGCIKIVPDPGGLPETFVSSSLGFSIRYPANFTVNPTYQYQEFGPGKEINGVSFTIPPSMASGTNLGADSYLSVEHIATTTACSAALFLPAGDPSQLKLTTTTDEDVTYSFATMTGAGAGNRYEETVFALPGTSPCLAVRYFVHYSVLENYPPGLVRAFDHQALLHQFDMMRRSLTLE